MDGKKDLFVLIRQLGKPTMFLIMSVNEHKWPHLLSMLHRINNLYKDTDVQDPLVDLNRSKGSTLVNEDTVICCIYVYRLRFYCVDVMCVVIAVHVVFFAVHIFSCYASCRGLPKYNFPLGWFCCAVRVWRILLIIRV
jgi:hypothetical protein